MKTALSGGPFLFAQFHFLDVGALSSPLTLECVCLLRERELGLKRLQWRVELCVTIAIVLPSRPYAQLLLPGCV